MALPSRESQSRRDYLRSLVAVGGAAALAACLDETDDEETPRGDPDERPDRQHAWNDALDTDEDGNVIAPEHHSLLALELAGTPDGDDAATVEAALETLEEAYAYDNAGLLFTLGYAPAYFEAIGEPSPIPAPAAVTPNENPDLDEFHALVHLASDDPAVVLETEEALVGEEDEANGVTMDENFEGILKPAEPRRTGFIGPGLPAEHTDLDGVPDSVPEDAPFFMGFRAGFAESQATEEYVTIDEGPYAGGTTTHVESLGQQLHTWFEQESRFQRVAQLFSPEHADEDTLGEIGENLGNSTGIAGEIGDRTAEDARNRGLVGHAQKAARARDENGLPRLLRRDFNTVDGDRPGVHFLSHQETIADFVDVRQAMEGMDVAGEGVGQAHNNGILQYIFVQRRGNFLVPPRDDRALPGV